MGDSQSETLGSQAPSHNPFRIKNERAPQKREGFRNSERKEARGDYIIVAR
jgi:hypothetical protein